MMAGDTIAGSSFIIHCFDLQRVGPLCKVATPPSHKGMMTTERDIFESVDINLRCADCNDYLHA